jgi:predicted nucleotidyltransferase
LIGDRRVLFEEVGMNREAILALLNAEAPELCRKYGVRSLSLFGSMARGDDREASDVDVLDTFEGSVTFRCFMGLKLDLEDLFGGRVDLLTPKRLSPAMRDEIDKTSVIVVEDTICYGIMNYLETL